MNPAIEKLEKEISLGKETKGHCVILGWPLTGKMLEQQVLVLESLKACVEALDNTMECFDAARFEGAFDPHTNDADRLEILHRRLLYDLEPRITAALQLFNRAMGVSHE